MQLIGVLEEGMNSDKKEVDDAEEASNGDQRYS